jgi:hypothetical protein
MLLFCSVNQSVPSRSKMGVCAVGQLQRIAGPLAEGRHDPFLDRDFEKKGPP